MPRNDHDRARVAIVRWSLAIPVGPLGRPDLGGLGECHERAAQAPVQSDVAERHAIVHEGDRQQGASPFPWIATDLEDVGCVEIEVELDLHRLGMLREVRDREPLLESARQDSLTRDAE